MLSTPVITVGTRSVVKKGGSLLITVPAETTRWMNLEAGDQVIIKYDPFNKQMIVERLTIPSREEEEEMLRTLQETGAYFPKMAGAREHYKLASGKHSDHYVFVRLTLSDRDRRLRIAHIISKHFEDDNIRVVAAFTVGGALLGNQVRKLLGAKLVVGRKTEEGKIEFENLFKINEGDNILLVDDVLTTGGSIRKAMEVISSSTKGVIKGVAIVVDRSKRNTDLGVKTVGLVALDLAKYDSKTCPLCQQGLQLVNLSRVESDKAQALSVLAEESRNLMANGFEEYEKLLEDARQEAKNALEAVK